MEILFGVLVGVWWAGSRRKKRAARLAALEAQRAHLDQQLAGQTVAVPLVLEGPFAYWLVDGILVRSSRQGYNVDFDHVEKVDPLSGDYISPVHAIEILEALESANTRDC